MTPVKKTPVLNTKKVKGDKEQEILRQAAEIEFKDRAKREEAFNIELQKLCEKYKIHLRTQMIITAL